MALTHEQQKLVNELGIGISTARKADDLAPALGLSIQRTDEKLRQIIRESILNENLPIGSGPDGFFIIDSDQELEGAIQVLETRIEALQERIEALRLGWAKRKQTGNWPK